MKKISNHYDKKNIILLLISFLIFAIILAIFLFKDKNKVNEEKINLNQEEVVYQENNDNLTFFDNNWINTSIFFLLTLVFLGFFFFFRRKKNGQLQKKTIPFCKKGYFYGKVRYSIVNFYYLGDDGNFPIFRNKKIEDNFSGRIIKKVFIRTNAFKYNGFQSFSINDQNMVIEELTKNFCFDKVSDMIEKFENKFQFSHDKNKPIEIKPDNPLFEELNKIESHFYGLLEEFQKEKIDFFNLENFCSFLKSYGKFIFIFNFFYLIFWFFYSLIGSLIINKQIKENGILFFFKNILKVLFLLNIQGFFKIIPIIGYLVFFGYWFIVFFTYNRWSKKFPLSISNQEGNKIIFSSEEIDTIIYEKNPRFFLFNFDSLPRML